MKLFVTAPKQEINASWTRLTRIILLITGIIIAIFFILSTLTIRIITDPLVRLTSASEKLSAGDYNVELKYEGKDEVGKLTSAFSRMRDHLQNYISDLNRRIHTDDLTGLPNIFYFQKLAEAERKRLKETGKEPAFLHFNLIGMKYYNRQFGYSEGDHLIIETGKIIADQFGESCCARFGLDQYVAICEENGLEETDSEETGSEEAASEERSRDDTSSAGNTADTPAGDSVAGTDKAGKQFTYQLYYHRRTGTYWMTGLDPFEDYEGNPFGEYPRRGAFAQLVRYLGGTSYADRHGGSWKIGSSTWNASVKTIRTAGSPYTYSGIRMTRNGNTTYLDQVPEAFEGTGATAAGRPFSIHDLIRMLGVRITINQREMTAVMFPDAGDAE